jgi:cytoskeletal protein CcmA (bactofilin family)
MWKPNQAGTMNPIPESSRPATAPAVVEQPSRMQTVSTVDQSTIGKGMSVKGDISGTESLFIDGRLEGNVNLPGNRVTVGRNGQVTANIVAREVVIHGKIRGNVSAMDRVDIRAEGALNGDVAAARISIEEGAFFKGGIDIRKPDAKPAANSVPEPQKASQA